MCKKMYDRLGNEIEYVVGGDPEFANNNWLERIIYEVKKKAAIQMFARGYSIEKMAEILDMNGTDVLKILYEESVIVG